MKPSEKPLSTRPVNAHEQMMRERFAEAVADQSRLMDTLAQQLLTVELAIPGLYATLLKLASGADRLSLSWWVYAAFGCWLAALACALRAIFPRKYRDVVYDSPDSIEDFFDRAARFKRRWLLVSVLLFVGGLALIVMDVLL